VPLQIAVDLEDCSHDGWGNAPRCYTDECNALHSRSLKTDNAHYKNCFEKCGFSNYHVSSNDDSAVKLTEDEEDDWHSLQALGMQIDDFTT
jgi:hypothetical protein